MIKPNFLIAGGVATGTSFLSALLAKHPKIYLPRIQRPEPNFFHYTHKYQNGLDWYLNTWFSDVGDQRITGERSSLLLPSENGIEGIYLYHLSRVNLGNRTPLLEYSDQDDANTILEILKRRGFFENGFPIAVHSQKNLDAPFLAQKVEISYAPTGFHVCASAQGRSGLLLPLTFSHCLEFIPKGKSQFFEKPKLYRANLAQTLLIFNQKVEGEVRYFSSPFYNPLAVWKDVLDGRRIFGSVRNP